MQKKNNRRFLFLPLASIAREPLQANKLLLSYKKAELFSLWREKFRFVSRFFAILVGS